MSKAQQKETYNTTQQNTKKNATNQDSANTQLQGVLSTAQDTAKSILPGVVSGYSDISSSGGFDPSILGQVNNTYTDMAKTGGISPEQVVAMKNEASNAARATYDIAGDEAKRATTTTGGYGLSGSITGNLARKGSEAAARAAVSTDASIAGMQQFGKLAGASGLASTQQNIVGNKLAAQGGLSNIYGMNEAQISTTVSQILQNYQQTGQLNAQDLSILTNLANQPGVFDKIIGTIGTLGGAAAGVMGGMGAMSGAGKK